MAAAAMGAATAAAVVARPLAGTAVETEAAEMEVDVGAEKAEAEMEAAMAEVQGVGLAAGAKAEVGMAAGMAAEMAAGATAGGLEAAAACCSRGHPTATRARAGTPRSTFRATSRADIEAAIADTRWTRAAAAAWPWRLRQMGWPPDIRVQTCNQTARWPAGRCRSPAT